MAQQKDLKDITVQDSLKIVGETFASPLLKMSQSEHLVLMAAYDKLREFIEINTKK